MLSLPDAARIPFWLHSLRRNLYLSPEQLRERQQTRLAAILHHAYERVPYYRDLFDRVGLKPQEIRTPDDLLALPVTTKADLRKVPRQALITPPPKGVEYLSTTTSGSTGAPFQIQVSRQEHWLKSLGFIRTFLETGYRLTDRQALVDDTLDEEKSQWWFQRYGLFRKYYVSVFDDLDVQIAQLRRIRPQHIHGFPSTLKYLARTLLEKGITEVRPRIVCTGAEVLDRETRETISRGFRAPVLDLYSSVELGNIAWECPTGKGYHLNSDLVLVEFLVDGRAALPGERAEVVCTSLLSYTMPFIRYSVGDVARPLAGPCPCGRGLPLMGPVEGRLVDMIALPSGRKVSPYNFIDTMNALAGIEQYQVLQKTATHILVQIVPGEGFNSALAAKIKAACQEIVAQEAQIDVVAVETIPLEKSGKFRVVKSELET